MAIQAAVEAVRFDASATPGEFVMTARAWYFDEAGAFPFADISVALQFGGDSAAINSALLNATIAQAPPGFEVTADNILIPEYSSGSEYTSG